MGVFHATLNSDSIFNASLAGTQTFNVGFTDVVEVTRTDYYDGPYDFIPGDDDQIIDISGKTATDNIVVYAIPSNYGKVSYDGSVLLVQ